MTVLEGGTGTYENQIWPEISTHSMTVLEGGTGTYTVALSSQPAEDFTVDLRVLPATHLTVSPEELTFTTENWATVQTVTLTAGTDDDDLNSWQEIVHLGDLDGFVNGHVKVLIED